jgi:hypothetical protein
MWLHWQQQTGTPPAAVPEATPTHIPSGSLQHTASWEGEQVGVGQSIGESIVPSRHIVTQRAEHIVGDIQDSEATFQAVCASPKPSVHSNTASMERNVAFSAIASPHGMGRDSSSEQLPSLLLQRAHPAAAPDSCCAGVERPRGSEPWGYKLEFVALSHRCVPAAPPNPEGWTKLSEGWTEPSQRRVTIWRQFSDGGALAQCAETCAQRRSQVSMAIVSGGQRAAPQPPAQLPSVAAQRPSASSKSAELAGFRDADSSTVVEARGVGQDISRAVAAHSHHQQMRMLASEQQQLPAAGRLGARGASRADLTAQVLPLNRPFVPLISVWLNCVSVRGSISCDTSLRGRKCTANKNAIRAAQKEECLVLTHLFERKVTVHMLLFKASCTMLLTARACAA